MFGKKKDKQDFTGLTIYAAFHHVNGLPIPEDVLCEVFSYPDKLEFKAGATDINLSKDKIADISINTDVDIQNHAVSSAGGAVGGAIMFGALGAVIGGRVKTKKIKTITQYLIITYMSDNEVKYIGFDIKNNPPAATKLVNEFKKTDTQKNIQIDL